MLKSVMLTLVLVLSAVCADALSWPCFQGANHDSICLEKGLLKSWPEEGPKLLWKFDALGKGYATVSFAEGMIFTAGDVDGENCLFALDMSGKLVWKQATGKSWDADYPGSRGTPTYNEGILYHLTGAGILAALNAKTGKIAWSVDIAKDYGARIGGWGLAESILIDGKNVICLPGGKGNLVVALDKKTGKKVWNTSELSDEASYCSPVIANYAGVRQLLTLSAQNAVGINADTGKLLWKFKYVTGCDVHATTPVYKDGSIFITSNYGKDSKLLKLSTDGTSVTEAWSSHDMENHHGGVVLVDGYIYGSGNNCWSCIDFASGKTAWKVKKGKGSILFADGMLYLLNENGKLALIEASSKEYKEAGAFELPKASEDTFWAHPVICDGRLYIRHASLLYVYDLKK